MLPLILDEGKVFVFKFWFNNKVQDGMSYRNELFCRLRSYDLTYRPQVYHLGCKLAQEGGQIALTSAATTCSLWVSLRDAAIDLTIQQVEASPLPYIELATQSNPLTEENS